MSLRIRLLHLRMSFLDLHLHLQHFLNLSVVVKLQAQRMLGAKLTSW